MHRSRKERTWKYRRKKRIMISILSVLLIAGISAGFLFRIRGSRIMTVTEETGTYDAEGNLQWDVLGNLDGLHTEVPQTLEPESITEHLRRKVYPIIRVRMHGLGNFHYVLIVKAEHGMYYCMDPLKQDQIPVPLSEYGNRGYAVRYVY